ncbi:hypothetical protein Z949_667 [Sulfitobacter guttiformis KCTC 32187]|nr:hypothetical protein Z949_667 [Sulfitobacter guttiformis KCTC 32187]
MPWAYSNCRSARAGDPDEGPFRPHCGPLGSQIAAQTTNDRFGDAAPLL